MGDVDADTSCPFGNFGDFGDVVVDTLHVVRGGREKTGGHLRTFRSSVEEGGGGVNEVAVGEMGVRLLGSFKVGVVERQGDTVEEVFGSFDDFTIGLKKVGTIKCLPSKQTHLIQGMVVSTFVKMRGDLDTMCTNPLDHLGIENRGRLVVDIPIGLQNIDDVDIIIGRVLLVARHEDACGKDVVRRFLDRERCTDGGGQLVQFSCCNTVLDLRTHRTGNHHRIDRQIR